MKYLDGYKTYILTVILMAVGIMHFKFGLIDNELAALLYSILGPGLAITLRSGSKTDVAKLEDKINGK